MVGTPTKNDVVENLLASVASETDELFVGEIADRNLACAAGLPGSESLDVIAALERIDRMAERVGAEIHRNYHRFVANPAEGQNSQAKYCVLMMVTVLQQDFGVRYNPERIRNPDFRDSADLFVHGMLNGIGGTCASMPVLYTAVGRRLGWPIKMVHARSHLFCRWDDPDCKHPFAQERFNVEATGQGANFFPDDYYRGWPEPISDEMIERLGYLNSLTPEQELADFLVMRGHCLEDNGWIGKACDSYKAACQLTPNDLINRAFWEHAELVRDRLIEQQTLLDYFGPDVPLPFGCFPRHVLRQMASDMLRTEAEFTNRMNQLERERFKAKIQSRIQAGRPTARHPSNQIPGVQTANRHLPPSFPNLNWNAGLDATGLPNPPALGGLQLGLPTIPGLTNVGSPFAPLAGIIGATLPEKLLRAVDPQRLAMRRQEAIAISKSLPPAIQIKQPHRLLLVTPKKPESNQHSSLQEH